MNRFNIFLEMSDETNLFASKKKQTNTTKRNRGRSHFVVTIKIHEFFFLVEMELKKGPYKVSKSEPLPFENDLMIMFDRKFSASISKAGLKASPLEGGHS